VFRKGTQCLHPQQEVLVSQERLFEIWEKSAKGLVREEIAQPKIKQVAKAQEKQVEKARAQIQQRFLQVFVEGIQASAVWKTQEANKRSELDEEEGMPVGPKHRMGVGKERVAHWILPQGQEVATRRSEFEPPQQETVVQAPSRCEEVPVQRHEVRREKRTQIVPKELDLLMEEPHEQTEGILLWKAIPQEEVLMQTHKRKHLMGGGDFETFVDIPVRFINGKKRGERCTARPG